MLLFCFNIFILKASAIESRTYQLTCTVVCWVAYLFLGHSVD